MAQPSTRRRRALATCPRIAVIGPSMSTTMLFIVQFVASVNKRPLAHLGRSALLLSERNLWVGLGTHPGIKPLSVGVDTQ